MTEAQYRVLCKISCCWICGREHKKDGSNLRLYVDHDHVTGRVRGRLCYTCNRRLIGRRRHGILYRKASEYLDSDFDGRKIEVAKEVAEAETGVPEVRLRRRKTSEHVRPRKQRDSKDEA